LAAFGLSAGVLAAGPVQTSLLLWVALGRRIVDRTEPSLSLETLPNCDRLADALDSPPTSVLSPPSSASDRPRRGASFVELAQGREVAVLGASHKKAANAPPGYASRHTRSHEGAGERRSPCQVALKLCSVK
jgi:hypothetical protein